LPVRERYFQQSMTRVATTRRAGGGSQ